MKDSQKTKIDQTNPADRPLIDNLHPSQLSLDKSSTDEKDKNNTDIVDKWLNNVQKEVSELLEKHGVTIYQLSILHDGTNSPMIMARGNVFEAAKLAVSAARLLRGQIAEDLSMDK